MFRSSVVRAIKLNDINHRVRTAISQTVRNKTSQNLWYFDTEQTHSFTTQSKQILEKNTVYFITMEDDIFLFFCDLFSKWFFFNGVRLRCGFASMREIMDGKWARLTSGKIKLLVVVPRDEVT